MIHECPCMCAGVIGSYVPWLEFPACNAFCTIIVYVQDISHFNIDLISDPGQGHIKICFSAYFM